MVVFFLDNSFIKFLFAFKTWFLSLVNDSFSTVFLVVDFLFILLGICWTCEIRRLMSFISSGKFLNYFSLSCFCPTYSLFSFWDLDRYILDLFGLSSMSMPLNLSFIFSISLLLCDLKPDKMEVCKYESQICPAGKYWY